MSLDVIMLILVLALVIGLAILVLNPSLLGLVGL